MTVFPVSVSSAGEADHRKQNPHVSGSGERKRRPKQWTEEGSADCWTGGAEPKAVWVGLGGTKGGWGPAEACQEVPVWRVGAPAGAETLQLSSCCTVRINTLINTLITVIHRIFSQPLLL